MPKIKGGFYAVADGRNVGVYNSWGECEAQVRGYSGSRHKKFGTLKEAQDFIQANGSKNATEPSSHSMHSSVAPMRRTGVVRTSQRYPATPARNTQQPMASSQQSAAFTSASSAPPPRRTGVVRTSHRYPAATIQTQSASSAFTNTNSSSSSSSRMTISIHFDGGSRGNPGVAGSGAVISIRPSNNSSSNGALAKDIHICRFVGNNHTNNQAEYQGAIEALKVVKKEIDNLRGNANVPQAIDLEVHGDSNLVIQQLKGSWQCRNQGLQPLHRQATQLLDDIRRDNQCKVSLSHVYRDSNQDADRLANLAMDAKESFVTTDKDAHVMRRPL